MCRRNILCGCCAACMGLGVLLGSGLESGLLCIGLGIGLTVLGLGVIRQK